MGTPLYIYSTQAMQEAYKAFTNAFSSQRTQVCFAMKSNSNLAVIKTFADLGAGADVVSIGELLKAKRAGINSQKIVFSGIGKTEDEIRMAIKKRVLLINVESENEVNLINKISKKISKKTSIGIRLNPNISGNTHK